MTAKCPECESSDYIDPETGECSFCTTITFDPPASAFNGGYSREACLKALDRANDRFDDPITSAEYKSLGISPSFKTIVKVCGSWNDAKRAVGIPCYDSTGAVVE